MGLGSGQKSFRAREKFLIVLVFLTFCFVCFCGLFYLPEFGSSRVLNVYQQLQRAGPEMFIPAPPIQQPNHHHHQQHNNRASGEVRDPLLMAKIKEELGDLNLDRPETANQRKLEDSSVSGNVNHNNRAKEEVDVESAGAKVLLPPNQIEESRREVQQQQGQQMQQPRMNPVPIPKSDDSDVDVTEKRNKVKEVSGECPGSGWKGSNKKIVVVEVDSEPSRSCRFL